MPRDKTHGDNKGILKRFIKWLHFQALPPEGSTIPTVAAGRL